MASSLVQVKECCVSCGDLQLVSDKILVEWNKQARERVTKFRKPLLENDVVDLLQRREIKD
jgi:hypothetical protein